MTNLDWFERVTKNLESKLYDECNILEMLIDSNTLDISSSTAEKHPTISIDCKFPFEMEPESINLHFDPYNQEFYSNVETEEFEVRVILKNFDEIINFIHQEVHKMAISQVHEFEDMIGDNIPNFGAAELFNQIFGAGEEFSVGQEINNEDIKWFPENVVTHIVEDDQRKRVSSIRLGDLPISKERVLAQFETIYINDEITSEHAALFPFKLEHSSIIQNLLTKHM